MSTAQDVAAPDLSAFDYPTLVRIAVAEAQGWTFAGLSSDGRPIGIPPEPALSRRRRYFLGDTCLLPEFRTDPAAWWPLVELDLAGIERVDNGWAAWFFDASADMGVRTETADTPGAAVCAAYLDKHGVTVDASQSQDNTYRFTSAGPATLSSVLSRER